MPDHTPESAGARCEQTGCPVPPVDGCHYIDAEGRLCVTAWCAEHRAHAGVIPYCRRHVGLVLARESGRIVGPAPGIDNRSPSLLAYVCDALEAPIERMLGVVATARGEDLTSTAVEMVNSSGAEWRRTWSVGRDGAETLRLLVTVAEATDPEMTVMVNNRSLTFLVPWITRRLEGSSLPAEEDASERSRFFAELLTEIRKEVDAALTA